MCSQILCQLQTLVVTQSVGHLVAPVAIQVPGTLFDGSYRLFPFKTVRGTISVGTLYVAATGEAHETWVKVGQHLCQVLTATVGTILEGRWEEADHVQINNTLHRAFQHQPPLSLVACSSDGGSQLLPFLCGVDIDGRPTHLLSVGFLQFSRDNTIISILCAEPKGELISASTDDIDAPIALIANATTCRFDVHTQRSLLHSIQHIVTAKTDGSVAYGAPRKRAVHILLKRAIAHQLSV